jgi:transketolase
MSISSKKLAKEIRISALKMVSKAKASHIGSALSIVDILAVLYEEVMKYKPSDPNFVNRDRFILSKGHACVSVYAALAEVGFFKKEELKSYGENFSNLMNHISHKISGVEFSTGALGHGLPFAVGKALSAKFKDEEWSTFVVLSDGEMDEGSNWEALMFASHHKLDNLTGIIDYNKLQSLDSISNTLALEPLDEKLNSFGCHTIVIDGHNHDELKNAFSESSFGKPKIIIANTIKGKGVSFMENSVAWHYKSPTENELESALIEINNEE